AMETACYTQNRSIIRLRHGKTPYELLHNKLPDLSLLHVFGALCYPTNDIQADSIGSPSSTTVDQDAPSLTLEVIAPIANVIPPVQADSTDSPSSTMVDQDAPSLSKSHITIETQSLVIPPDVEEDNLDMEVTHMRNDLLFGVPILEVTSAQSSSTGSPHPIVQPDHPIPQHITNRRRITHYRTLSVNSLDQFPHDEGTGSILEVLSVPIDESEEELSWNSTDEEGDDDEGKDGNGEEDLGLNVGREEGHDEEEAEDKLYRDVNINQGRGIQTTLEVEDSYVTLTPVNPDGMDSIFETTSQMDVQTPTSVSPLPTFAPTLTSSTIATITTTQQAPLPPTTALSTIIQDLPNFGSLFCFDNRPRTLEANFSEFMQTNQFAGVVSSIFRIVHRYIDQVMNEAVHVAIQL
nr:retrovirus-related Pol polyprotein from transposon TNT 1-94 [Tanacetum cinerariifolium]